MVDQEVMNKWSDEYGKLLSQATYLAIHAIWLRMSSNISEHIHERVILVKNFFTFLMVTYYSYALCK